MNLSAMQILIVDDNSNNRDVLIRRLKRLGLENVVQAVDGIEALEILPTRPFDLVLLDVMMPRMNGVEVLKAMQAERRLEDTPVIMISAASELDTVVRCIELGAEDYLSKPFNPALLGARVTAVLEKKALRAENRAQLARLEQELAEARAHQLSMLPTEFPIDPAIIDVHAFIDPALEVGGDLYDVFAVGPNQLCVAVGDVAGKGTAAALFMARTRSLLRAGTLQFFSIAQRMPRPSEVASLVNAELCKNNPNSTFVTLLIAFLDIADGQVTYCNAGHVYPVVAGGSGVSEIINIPDPPLGALEGLTFADHTLQMATGDTLILMSDGLADMRNPAMESFGDERVLSEIEAANGAPLNELVDRLVSSARLFADGAPQFDDVTVLALRRAGFVPFSQHAERGPG